jgi:hypothetical protein
VREDRTSKSARDTSMVREEIIFWGIAANRVVRIHPAVLLGSGIESPQHGAAHHLSR